LTVARFFIEGGNPVEGSIRPAGNKNAALVMLAASLLCPGPVRLRGVPDIGDVRAMLTILSELGVSISQDEDDADVMVVDSSNASPRPVRADLASRIRASLLLAGPMVARFGTVTLPPPGGDVIGRRRNDPHWQAFREIGVDVEVVDGGYCIGCRGGRARGGDILLDEMSVMATENVLMAAALGDGATVIRNAASEPHVHDLCLLLGAMGVEIDGLGSNLLRVEGVRNVDPVAVPEATVGPDYIEIGSFVGLAAATGGHLRIGPVRHDELRMITQKLAILGVTTHADGDILVVPPDQKRHITEDHGGGIPRIHEAPWPGFPADLMSILLVVATQSVGTVLLHQWMFESRLYFTDRLIEMGARIILADPHRAVVTGPAQLRGAILQSPDIRAGMAMLIAALAADGESEIRNIEQVDRGYERIDERLRSLGARISRKP
jgi:UDP-N-acetylglucosamine 1-carboxyvinyltransferase